MTARQANLLRRAHEKLVSSDELMKLGYFADAASRAYYVMFYVASALLAGEGLKYSSHAAVISAFGRVFAATGRLPSEFHRFLIDAYQGRIEGDYAEVFTLSAKQVAAHVHNAERFLKLAEELLGPAPPAEPPAEA